ncbi:MAG: nucleotidyltransferase family protein [Chitinophagales bacterium]
MWKETLIAPEIPILQAIELLDRTALQIALVVNAEGRLMGTVTDGDIRRAILKNLSLDQPVANIMNTNPSFVYREKSRENAILHMKNKKIRQVPVLDEDHRVIGLEITDDLFNPPARENWVILMAGGFGKRLQPLTDGCPKPLLKVGDKPLLETILESFIEQGFKNFYISVNYKAEMIINHFGDGSHWEVNISYLREKKPLGTVGSLGLLPAKPDKPVLLMNGDILTRMNFGQLLDFHLKSLTAATICVKEHYHQIPYGVVSIEKNRLQQIYEKPRQRFFVNAGLYVLSPEVLDHVFSDVCLDITDLFRMLLEKKKEIAVFPIREYWIDIGRFDDYERANNDFYEVFG